MATLRGLTASSTITWFFASFVACVVFWLLVRKLLKSNHALVFRNKSLKSKGLTHMAQFTIEVPDDQVGLIGEAFSSIFGDYDKGSPVIPANPDADPPTEEIPARPPEDPIAFARQKVIEYIQTTVQSHVIRKAQEEAVKSVPDQVLNIQ